MADTSDLMYEISVGADKCYIDYEKKEEMLREQALLEASAVGDAEKVLTLLDMNVSVDAEAYNKLLFYASRKCMTPLQLAVSNGHVQCMQILIDHHANVNAKDHFDVSALHMAAEKGNYKCLKALLESGADCSLPTKISKSGYYRVPTKYSNSGCNDSPIKFSKFDSYRTVPHLAGTTPLHLAAYNNNLDCVRELIQYGADYNAVDEYGRTSLYIAAQAGFKDCVLVHLKNAVSPDILSLPEYQTHDTPLHFAVLHRMADCVRELLYLGSDVNHLNIKGYSPLHISLIPHNINMGNNLEIIKLLILKGYNTDINLFDSEHFTPLHYACFTARNQGWLRRPEIATFLISYGANINIKNFHGSSLLQCELKSSEKDWEILKYVVKRMLQLPHLKDLNLSLQREPYPSFEDLVELQIRHEQNLLENVLGNRQRDFQPDLRRPLPENLSPLVIEKRMWYEQMASSPRVLQHCCRYVIRETLGPFRLKYVKSLPIPPTMQSYILLEGEK